MWLPRMRSNASNCARRALERFFGHDVHLRRASRGASADQLAVDLHHAGVAALDGAEAGVIANVWKTLLPGDGIHQPLAFVGLDLCSI